MRNMITTLILTLALAGIARAEDLNARLSALENGAPSTGNINDAGANVASPTTVTCYSWVAGCPGNTEYRAAQDRREREASQAKRDAAAQASIERQHRETVEAIKELDRGYRFRKALNEWGK